METHFRSLGFRRARGPGGGKNRVKYFTSRTTRLVLVIAVAGAVVPASAHAQGLFDRIFGSHKVPPKSLVAKPKPPKQIGTRGCGAGQLFARQSTFGKGSKGVGCVYDLGTANSNGFSIVTPANNFIAGAGGSVAAGVPGGGGAGGAGGGGTGGSGGGGGTGGPGPGTPLHGTNIAVSATIGMNGTVTVPGGGSLTVAHTMSVNDSMHVPVGTAPMSSFGFGSGMAMGSASSMGAGSANSNSFGNGNSFLGNANSGVGAGSSGGAGNVLGAGLGLGGGFGMSGSMN